MSAVPQDTIDQNNYNTEKRRSPIWQGRDDARDAKNDLFMAELRKRREEQYAKLLKEGRWWRVPKKRRPCSTATGRMGDTRFYAYRMSTGYRLKTSTSKLVSFATFGEFYSYFKKVRAWARAAQKPNPQAIIFTSAAETLSPAKIKAAVAAQVARLFPDDGKTSDLAMADLDALAAKLKDADVNTVPAPVDLDELNKLWAMIKDELEEWPPGQRRAGLPNGYYLVLPMGKDVVLLGHAKVRSFRMLDAPGVRPKMGRGDVREFMKRVKRKRGKKRKYPKGICKVCKAPVKPSHYIEYLEQSYCNRDWPLAYARPVNDTIDAIDTQKAKQRQAGDRGKAWAHL